MSKACSKKKKNTDRVNKKAVFGGFSINQIGGDVQILGLSGLLFIITLCSILESFDHA
ncbi:MAG: hypothetical protein ABFQ95_08400 [Pseudomonadota bacterium]